jgi:CheY-like chemotaxis protein
MSNAVSYTQKGSIRLSTEISNNTVVLTVKDSGAGIDKTNHPLIFKEFFQLPSNDGEKKQGVGLGLSIVDKLCKLQAIPLSLDSQPGEGSSFSITLPLKELLSDDITEPRTLPIKPFAQENILLIDDDPYVLEAISELLAQWNLNVWPAKNFETALALKDKFKSLDLLITDDWVENNNKALDIIEAFSAQLNNQSRVLIITGNTAPKRLQELAASPYQVLHKPIDSNQLYRSIRLMLN